MATKRRYKRRTYRKKKRTQKRRVRRGGFQNIFGSKTPPVQSSNTAATVKQNDYFEKIKNSKQCVNLKKDVDYCDDTNNFTDQNYQVICNAAGSSETPQTKYTRICS